MKRLSQLIIAIASVGVAWADDVKRNIPYAEPANERQMLDVYSPRMRRTCPWSSGFTAAAGRRATKRACRSSRRLSWTKGSSLSPPTTDSCRTSTWRPSSRDVAKSIRWVHDHIAEYGGDPKRLFVMGHSAGAQLAALICTDDRYLKAEGLSLAIIKGCVPVDGDTYDVPPIIETAAARRRPWASPIRSSATARSSATIRRSTATSPPSPTWPATKAFRRS